MDATKTKKSKKKSSKKISDPIDETESSTHYLQLKDRDISSLPPSLKAAASGNLEELKLFLRRESQDNTNDQERQSKEEKDGKEEKEESEEEESASSVNEKDSQERTALHWASLKGHEECVKYLLESGANANANDVQGRTPLHFAASANHPSICSILLKHGAKMGARGKDLKGINPLHCSIITSSFASFQCLLQNASPENLEEVEKKGKTLLHLAAAHEDPLYLTTLLSEGDELSDEAKEALLSLLNAPDSRSRTPLHFAALENRLENVKLLLRKEVKVDCKDKEGNTPLHLAAKHNFRAIVAALMSAHANPMAKNKNKETPLHFAAANREDDICHILSTNGGDISIRYAFEEAHLRTPSSENYKLDRYGFIVKERMELSPEQAKLEEKRFEKENERAKKWTKMMGFKFEEGGAQFYTWEKEPDKLQKRIEKGIPDRVRWQGWKLLSGFKQLKNNSDVSYSDLKKKKAALKWTEQIDKDVLRTQRDHLMFRERFSIGQLSLFNVLKAYSVYDKEVGYCQGMSGLAAIILMYIEEEDAFWMVVQLWTNPKYNLRETFKDGFPLANETLGVFQLFFKKKLPKLFKHFEEEEVGETFMFRWFLMVFNGAFPFPVFLRIWDLFLYEGYDIVYTIAYGTLKFYEGLLLKKKMDEILFFFQDLSDKMTDDVDEFMGFVLKHRVTASTIKKFRKLYASKAE